MEGHGKQVGDKRGSGRRSNSDFGFWRRTWVGGAFILLKLGVNCIIPSFYPN